MKKFLFLTIILVFTCSSLSFAKVIKRHYPDGTLQAVVSFDKKGKRNGHYRTYWPNGKLMEQGTYKNGVLVGPIKQYSIDGGLLNQ